MREILYRGRSIETCEWAFGSLLIINKEDAEGKPYKAYFIVNEENYRYEVYPETVGQFTGLTIKRKKVFEHDIVENNGCHGYPKWKPKQVVWGNKLDKSLAPCCGFMLDGTQMFLATNDKDMRLLGNIHDNPELLKT